MKRLIGFTAILLATVTVYADGPRDNDPSTVRRVPRLGIEVSSQDQLELNRGLSKLAQAIAQLESLDDPTVTSLLPDVKIFYRAVHDALKHQEFFDKRDVGKAKNLLKIGQTRAQQLLAGKSPWTTKTGLVVRGYLSKIDDTVQPYGLVIPQSYQPNGERSVRCDLWFHGRGETLSEVKFIDSRLKQVGQYSPPNTIVLHPYGRYSNAFKFAGEVDVLEALQSVRNQYRIDSNRISVRGFSMGGAACWQFAVHYADRWFAANPGAGFSETPEFLKFFQKETLNPTWYERKLWHWYDCTDYAANLFHCPTIAYSGEIDIQKQAADIMAVALQKEGIDMLHIIGPQTAHRIHPDSKTIIEKRMTSVAARGRTRLPRKVQLVTYTLKYNRMHWVTIDSLKEHWSRSRVNAEIAGSNRINVKTTNVAGLTLSMPPGWSPLDVRQAPQLTIDGQQLEAPRPQSDRSFLCRLHREDGKWKIGRTSSDGIRKRHNLQGPIDDAFMDSFLFVRPTGKSSHAAVNEWVQSELEHAQVHWRRQFRGDARIKDDSAITDDDIASANLVLWGDPSSNAVLKKIVDRLPIQWTEKEIIVGNRKFPADHHALVLIFPNPLNPNRYVVLNSGFTYREFAYLNNARQVSKLPDWAIVDLRTPPNSKFPGKIADADFFGEKWELRPPRK